MKVTEGRWKPCARHTSFSATSTRDNKTTTHTKYLASKLRSEQCSSRCYATSRAASAANEDNGGRPRLHLETCALRVIGIVSVAHALLPRSSGSFASLSTNRLLSGNCNEMRLSGNIIRYTRTHVNTISTYKLSANEIKLNKISNIWNDEANN